MGGFGLSIMRCSDEALSDEARGTRSNTPLAYRSIRYLGASTSQLSDGKHADMRYVFAATSYNMYGRCMTSSDVCSMSTSRVADVEFV